MSIKNFYTQQEVGQSQSAELTLKYLKKLGKKGSMLVVGSKTELLLDQARKDGWEVYGTQGPLKDADFPANFFDAAVLKDVIEHLTKPQETLELIRHVLKPTGILCCHTPEMASLNALFNETGFVVLKIRSHSRRVEIFVRKSRQLKYLHELETPIKTDAPKNSMKVCVVLPAYNAAATLKRTLADIPPSIDEIILVDDASQDNTAELARSLGLKVFAHQKNKGYGGNQKTCYKKALELGADIVVMLHPDYQYDPTAISKLIEPILLGQADAVFGSRMMKGGALEGGMPLWKHNANILLTALENVVLGIYLTEYHSGFRAYSAKYLRAVNYEANSDGFIFDTEIIVQGVVKYMKIEEVPIRTRYFDEASTIKLGPSIIYGLGILRTLFKFLLYKHGLHLKQFE